MSKMLYVNITKTSCMDIYLIQIFFLSTYHLFAFALNILHGHWMSISAVSFYKEEAKMREVVVLPMGIWWSAPKLRSCVLRFVTEPVDFYLSCLWHSDLLMTEHRPKVTIHWPGNWFPSWGRESVPLGSKERWKGRVRGKDYKKISF